MKNFNTILKLSIILILCISTASFAQSKGKRYGLKKAHIEYKVDGSMQSGSEDLYFDNWGAKEAKFSLMKVSMGGFSQETKTATYAEGPWIYTIDLGTNTGTKSENPFLKNMDDKELQDLGKDMMKNMGGKKVGEEKILDKTCEIWEIADMGTKTWVWNWVPLKTEVNMGGFKMTHTAVKISDSFDIKKLNRPDIEYKDSGNMMDMMNKLKNFKKK